MLESFFGIIFGWSVDLNPIFGLAFITLILTLVIILIYKYFTNQEEMKALKEETTLLQKQAKETKDMQKRTDLSKKMMEKQMAYMKHTLMPLLLTFLPIIIVFGWIRNIYGEMSLNFLGFIDNWIWVYIIFTLIFNTVLRKVLKVY